MLFMPQIGHGEIVNRRCRHLRHCAAAGDAPVRPAKGMSALGSQGYCYVSVILSCA